MISLVALIGLALSSMPLQASAKRPPAAASRLEGTWYLLIHYKDDLTPHPEATRWLDRVWTFSIRGSRLVWTDYPLVVIEDPSGRFEALGRNPSSRVVGPWEPNSAQWKEIMDGPRVNSRGSRSKSLRGSDRKGWKSLGGQNMNSTSSFGYVQTWIIGGREDAEAPPTFEILESIGNQLSEGENGKTVYRDTRWTRAGEEVRGHFGRDGTRSGTFRMFHTKDLRALLSEDDEKTPNQKAFEKAMKGVRIPGMDP